MPDSSQHPRILHTVESTALGGAESLALTLALGMEARGYDPVFAVSRDGWLAERTCALGRETVLLPSRRAVDFGYIRWLTNLLRERGIDLIHAHMMGMNLYGGAAARRLHIPCIGTLHGRLYDLELGRRRLIYRIIGHLTSRLIAVSDDLGEALIHSGVPQQKVTVISNGVAILPKRKTNAEHCRVRLLSVGSLTDVKGHRFLLQAMPIIRETYPVVHLIIAGEGPCRRDLEALIDDLDLSDCVELIGRRDNVRELLQMSDVFVLPSVSEGQSLALLEAMAAGLPVVATCVGGNVEIVTDGESGLLVSPESPQALAHALIRLLSDPTAAARIGETGRQRVEMHFGQETMLDRYDALYQELLSGHIPHGAQQ